MWKWERKNPRVLSRLIKFANQSESFDVCNVQLLNENNTPIDPHQLHKQEKRKELVKAIYNALANKDILYTNEEYDESNYHQLIRTPSEILRSQRRGTCLDLAVLFCGMCWRYELIPLLIVSGNHAWAAVSLTHGLDKCKNSDRNGSDNDGGKNFFTEGLLTDKELARRFYDDLVMESEEYIVIECTGFTQGRFKISFDEAVNKAETDGYKKLDKFDTRNSFILDAAIADDFCWRDICEERLQAEKPNRLINSPLSNGQNPIESLYVQLGLIERKPDAKRRHDGNIQPSEGSRFNEPSDEDEVVDKFENNEFFDKVLKQKNTPRSQGKRLAIVGDPGGGKTTLLQKICYWVLEERQGLPIWVSLAAVNQTWLSSEKNEKDEGWLYRYLSENWLRNLAQEGENTPDEWKKSFGEILRDGKVWLLLDGADEMAISNPLNELKKQLTKGWAKSVRVLQSCRLNLWESEKEVLWEDFDIYRTLEFEYPEQVHNFIDQWFQNDNEVGQISEDLKTELDRNGRDRIRDLIKNPLRLALLCRIWKNGDGKLPKTKADFFNFLIENHYKWQDGKTNKVFEVSHKIRKELNKNLGILAKNAIQNKSSRFRLRKSFIDNNFNDASLLDWALKLGWLVDVGYPTKGEPNAHEKVYAFLHPTFQEYFAARAILISCT